MHDYHPAAADGILVATDERSSAMRNPTTPAIALLGAVLLLSACAATPAAPQTEPDPEPTVLEVPAIDGEWVLTRTVTDDTTGQYTPGTVETRYLIIKTPECDETSCSGTILSSSLEDIYAADADESDSVPSTYDWDGTSVSYEFPPVPVDCSETATGTVVAAGLYANTAGYSLDVGDGDAESVASFSGTGHLVVEVVGVDPSGTCPGGGEVEYLAELARR